MNTRANVGVLLLVLLAALGAVPHPSAALRQSATQIPTAASVTLHLSRSTADAGETLTLSATYANLGLVNTTLTVSRPNAVRFTPAVPTPCRFDVHPDGCRTFPLQALITGPVAFQATTNGETFHEGCQCWRFVTITSPVVTLLISGPPQPPLPPRAYLPMLTAPAAGSPPPGRMVFTSSRDVAYEIYGMRADGTAIQRLTTNTAYDEVADVSPDGATIVFQSQREGNVGLYLMNSDGTNQRRISPSIPYLMDNVPVWSPDGRQIAYTSFRDGNIEIYVMDADGANVRRLTTTSSGIHDTVPSWSPDGQMIAFNSNRDDSGMYSIYLMARDGTNVRRLTNGNDWWPAWSPDGAQIAFVALADGVGALSRIRSDGTQRTQVTTEHDVAGKPVWAPDGTMLAFNGEDPQALSGIYVVDADGSALRTVLQPDAKNIINDWTP